MADVVDPATRSRMMSGIRGKNTKPELLIRKALHARGFRYRLHCRDLPGNPDLCLPKYRAVIFVHGCFWHGHGCHLFKWPKTRPEFWREKIGRNRAVDEAAHTRLLAESWRVALIWECAIKGRAGYARLPEVSEEIGRWLVSDQAELEIGSDQ
ncbi:MAG: very short patch repair endonuclease [Brevundimonas sp.]|uniref:very short patch repair endonuclease n=1 Tax=Brevundimonas sp. TaxID=1871086 RepID=UPI002638ADF0|nr:very short patch repair endonuclease [Brevundimonas sp.]MDI6625332.1 very short patch repair endonuclease [Brevundimonas sp.]MDQ7813949.1 very short patch repair endonuclease [Brevundimonas sp.]